MRHQVKYRLSTTEALAAGSVLQLSGNAAHYLAQVLRLKAGEMVALFNRADGVFAARLDAVGKKQVTVQLLEQIAPPEQGTGLTVCFVPIRGGRLETIIEKATELGADVLQPVFTTRSVVDKVNLERAESIAREAAEQCERAGWPEIRPPVKLLQLLGGWPSDMPLMYGDETGGGVSAAAWLDGERVRRVAATQKWAILAGPEGGFTPEEFAALRKINAAQALGLGPRILRADTAILTLCVTTLMAWGDWHLAPRFGKDTA